MGQNNHKVLLVKMVIHTKLYQQSENQKQEEEHVNLLENLGNNFPFLRLVMGIIDAQIYLDKGQLSPMQNIQKSKTSGESKLKPNPKYTEQKNIWVGNLLYDIIGARDWVSHAYCDID